MNVLINVLIPIAALLVALTLAAPQDPAAYAPQHDDAAAFIDIADRDIVFTDRSALANKASLQSEQYNAFLHELYRFDAHNLQKVDSLYSQQQQHKDV